MIPKQPQPCFDQFESQDGKILLVEDDPEVLSLTKKVLEKNGYLVYPCRTAAEALAVYDRENGNLDLVLCDLILPDGKGLELIVLLKKSQPFLGTLLVSGLINDQEIFDQLKQQGIPYLLKPYTFGDLLKEIQLQCRKSKALMNGYYLQPEKPPDQT